MTIKLGGRRLATSEQQAETMRGPFTYLIDHQVGEGALKQKTANLLDGERRVHRSRHALNRVSNEINLNLKWVQIHPPVADY